MTFGTVIEIIVAVFTVFGLYHASKMIAFVLAYDKKVRKSIKVALVFDADDDDETRELKEMCARQVARDMFAGDEYIIIEDDKE